MTNVNTENFCIDPSKSLYDVNEAHFIISCGINTSMGIFSRISIACEDWSMNITDKDYNDLSFSISSRYLDDNQINDSSVS